MISTYALQASVDTCDLGFGPQDSHGGDPENHECHDPNHPSPSAVSARGTEQDSEDFE